MKRYKDFLTESIENVHEGDFEATKDMVSEGKLIKEKIPRVINGDFNCSDLNITTLEGGPEKVYGEFYCSYNDITSLEFCPVEVYGCFDCSYNRLTNLEFYPKKVNGDFYCDNNKITSLKFCPKEINGSFYCYDNEITSLEFGPEKVNGNFNCYDNKLTSLEFGPRMVSGGFDCLNNLNNLEIEKDFIEAGMFKNDYYKDLLNYMLSNNINLEKVKSWPEGFLSNNLKKSNKGTYKFNL